MRTPNNWQWNLTYQQEVFGRSSFEVAYVANYGYDLLKIHVANQIPSGDSNNNGRDDRNEFILTNNAALRQFGVFGNNNIGLWDHTGESTYHSLQSQFVSRFGRGSQFQASYTLSRSRANFAMTDSGQLAGNTTRLDNQNPRSRLGPPGDRSNPHLQLVAHLDAAVARGQVPPLPDGSWRLGDRRHPRSRHRSAIHRLHRWFGKRADTAGRPEPASPTTSGPTGSPARTAGPVVGRTSRSSTRAPTRSMASGSARSVMPSVATAPARDTSRPTWRSTRTSR